MSKYNGWTNWDTWNANLWLTNDENTYYTAQRITNANELASFFKEVFDNGSNEFDGIDYGCVNWYEILEGLNDE